MMDTLTTRSHGCIKGIGFTNGALMEALTEPLLEVPDDRIWLPIKLDTGCWTKLANFSKLWNKHKYFSKKISQTRLEWGERTKFGAKRSEMCLRNEESIYRRDQTWKRVSGRVLICGTCLLTHVGRRNVFPDVCRRQGRITRCMLAGPDLFYLAHVFVRVCTDGAFSLSWNAFVQQVPYFDFETCLGDAFLQQVVIFNHETRQETRHLLCSWAHVSQKKFETHTNKNNWEIKI